ncbi:STAS domain-containing protein [Streptomyces sp. NPDC054849]
MERDFRIVTRRFGPTAHVSLVGELDLDTRSALQDVRAALDENVIVVVFDMSRLTFLDVTGLHALLDLDLDLDRNLRGPGVTFFAYGWQAQPLRLLDLIDTVVPVRKSGPQPTAPLRRALRDAAESQRAAGAEAARRADDAVGVTGSR